MTVMSDIWIKEQCVGKDQPMITPFFPESVGKVDGIKHPSYGTSSYGYDVRLGNKFKVFRHPNEVTTPPSLGEYPTSLAEPSKNIIDTRTGVPEHLWKDIEADNIIIWPGACALGYTQERICMPKDILVVCMAKSSIARVFLQAGVTPIEPGWIGHITIELHNPTPYPIRVWAGDGIMQMLFIKGNEPCAINYADRNGKYMHQVDKPVPSKMLD